MNGSDNKILSLFIVYARKDKKWKDLLEKQMYVLVREGIINISSDEEILPGEEWAKSIDYKLLQADIILLLITPEFIGSEYCYEHEMKTAIQLHRDETALTVPIIVSPIVWEPLELPFSKLQVIPKDGGELRKDNDFNTEKAFQMAVNELTGLIKNTYKKNTNSVENFKKYFREAIQSQREIEKNISVLMEKQKELEKENREAEGKIRLISDYQERIMLLEEKTTKDESKISELNISIEEQNKKNRELLSEITSKEKEILISQKNIKVSKSLLIIFLLFFGISHIILAKKHMLQLLFGLVFVLFFLYGAYRIRQDLTYFIVHLMKIVKFEFQMRKPIMMHFLKKKLGKIKALFAKVRGQK